MTNSERTYTLVKYTDLRIGSNVTLEANLFLTFDQLKRILTISHGRQIMQQVILARGKNPPQIRVLLENSSIFISSVSGDIRFRFRTVPAECAEIVRKLQDVVNVEIVNRNNAVSNKLNNLPQTLFPNDFSQSQIISHSMQDCFSQGPMFSSSQELVSRSGSVSNIASSSQLSTMGDGLSSSSMQSFSSGSQNSVASAFSQSPFVNNFTQQEIRRSGSQLEVNGRQPGYVSSQLLSANGANTEVGSAKLPASFSSTLEQKPSNDKECGMDFNSLSDDALRSIIHEQLKNPEFRRLVDRLENINDNITVNVAQSGADSTPSSSQMFGTGIVKEEKLALPYAPRFTVPEKPSRSQFSYSQPGDSLLSRLEALQKY